MFFLLPSLLGILLVTTNQVEAACESNQCESLNDPSKCIDLLAPEELDCTTYTCRFQDGQHIMVKEEHQEPRCSIGGSCYTADEGPNGCTYCQVSDDNTTSVQAGCRKPDGKCVGPGSSFEDDRCHVMKCSVENHIATLSVYSTRGCYLEKQCYRQGEKTYRYTCNTCVFNSTEKTHSWSRECRDPRNNQCFKKGTLYAIFCRPYICSNRRGIGWYPGSATQCEVAPGDCIAVNSFSLRDGYCYYCEDTTVGAKVGCRACGQCLKPGETAQCYGDTVSCDNIVDPPDEEDIICQLDDKTLKVNERVEHKCNYYQCTKLGLRQLTFRCSYKGLCYRAGEVMDEALCLMCISDGMSSSSQQGCKNNDQCVKQGGIVQINCRTKQCVAVGNGYELRLTENQDTPCRCGGECYPVGPFQYGHRGLCADCKPDGTIHYACKLANGQCLDAGEVEANASMGCYKFMCEYSRVGSHASYRLVKAPNQPLICTLRNGECLDENESRVIDGRRYYCVSSDKCLFKGEILTSGDERVIDCHKYVCEAYKVDGVQTREMEIVEYGCPYANGDCMPRGTEFKVNCSSYECEVPEGGKTARPVLVTQRCPCFGVCLEVNASSWSSDCAKMTCRADGSLQVTEYGCKSKLADICLPVGLNITVNGQTETCDDTTAENNGPSGPISHCTMGGATVPYGGELNTTCNVYVCEERNGVAALHVKGTPRCTYSEGPTCIAQDDAYECLACRYSFNGTRHDFKFALAADSCIYGGTCFYTGAYKELQYQGSALNCTCGSSAENQLSCYRL